MTFITNPKPFILEANSLYLWRFSLNDSLSQNILNEEEKNRANRFYFERHQRRFTTARTRLREILGLYLSMNPEDLEFVCGLQGKPEVINQQQLHFNLSHTGEHALLGICKNYAVGVDIEQYSARPYQGIARNLFSEEELVILNNTPAFSKPAVFFRIWAQKEAFIKATGLGLSYPVQSFTVPQKTAALLEDELHHQTWQMHHFMYAAAIAGAFCCHPDISQFYMNSYP